MVETCCYCSSVLANRSSLNRHQRDSKRCLRLQGKLEPKKPMEIIKEIKLESMTDSVETLIQKAKEVMKDGF